MLKECDEKCAAKRTLRCLTDRPVFITERGFESHVPENDAFESVMLGKWAVDIEASVQPWLVRGSTFFGSNELEVVTVIRDGFRFWYAPSGVQPYQVFTGSSRVAAWVGFKPVAVLFGPGA